MFGLTGRKADIAPSHIDSLRSAAKIITDRLFVIAYKKLFLYARSLLALITIQRCRSVLFAPEQLVGARIEGEPERAAVRSRLPDKSEQSRGKNAKQKTFTLESLPSSRDNPLLWGGHVRCVVRAGMELGKQTPRL